MSKKWKVKLSNWFLRRYVANHGRLLDKSTLNNQIQFESIVIYSTTALGDFMFNTPVIRAVRQRYPDAYITLVAHRKNQHLVDNGIHYDRVVYWDNKVKSLPVLVASLKEHQPDLALILHSHLPYDVISAVMSGVNYIIRDNYMDGICGMEEWLSNYVFNYYGHFVRRKVELASVLGCDSSNVSMEIPSPYQPGVKDLDHTVIGMQIGASTESRCWPVGHFVKLADMLSSNHPNARIVLIGGGTDVDRGEAMLKQLSDKTKDIIDNLIGKTDLQQLITIIDGFDVLVTGDTGPLHLAVALKTKTISLFVTADSRSTGPIQDNELHRIIQVSRTGHTLALEKISPMGVIQPERVYAELITHLDMGVN
ncbi:glycosyltransferase family 9 protein [Ewingella americana]|uniref:Glycosyltransferase family 9 protein n=1 Tax=Ewingella americana TaxID=41202 RepID=A0A502G5J5_9GAMM|nr:glycosyltransferase family 9 protein [Ewingella americana]TPG57307.1 glycosyltransferase family 9 protein [Ewingella americana]